MNPAAPILFFDSGVGGLSVLGPTRALLPNAPIVYAADNAAFPYGTRSEAEIAARVPALLGRLVERYRPRLAVIACNTASTIALDHVRAALDIPVVGTVPAIRPAAALSKTRVIGVLGTEATVRQPYVDDLAAASPATAPSSATAVKELVELAEAKLAGGSTTPPPSPPRSPRCVLPAAARISTSSSSPAPISPCSPTKSLPHGPASPWSTAAPGIARRIAHLTAGQPWPDAPPPGIAVFTAPPPARPCARAAPLRPRPRS